jgi:4-hydroxy-3-polyprenylbenzoate decarboxylase
MAALPPRLVVGITGATGAVYGVQLLERARALGVETHLVVTPAGVLNAHHELGLDRARWKPWPTRPMRPATSAPAWPAAASTPRPWSWRPAR